MAKTKQIGVRFNKELLDKVKLSPQKALNLYEQNFEKDINSKPLINDEAKTNSGSLIPPQKELSTLAIKQPKTLDELKKLCPKELDIFDRGAWIREHRLKYGI